jgi:rhomboid-like protein
MLKNFFANITPVCKNLLFLNIIMFVFIATGHYIEVTTPGGHVEIFYERNRWLGMHYFSSPEFKPYQIVSYMFAHGSPGHLIFNMLSLVMFGSILERIWGPKRFLLFYLITGLGALALHEAVNAYQIYQYTGSLAPDFSTVAQLTNPKAIDVVGNAYYGPIVGASGAIFGLLIAFAMLFPNTELMLIFLPIPVKAKYFVPFLVIAELVLSQANFEGDNVAHYAHLGGALIGFIMVRIWQRNRNNFY